MTDSDLTTLIVRVMPELREYMRSRLNRLNRADSDTDDLMSEVFVRTLAAIRSHHLPSSTVVNNYLRNVVNSVLIDQFRKEVSLKRKRGSSNVNLTEWTRLVGEFHLHAQTYATPRRQKRPSEEFFNAEVVELISSNLESLPEDQREAVRLHHIEGLSYVDVANRMDRTFGSVKGLIARGVANLKKHIGPESSFFGDAGSDDDSSDDGSPPG